MFALGVDPGLASCGVCVMQIEKTREVVYETQVIVTEQSDKKLKVLAADDTFRRAREVAAVLRELVARRGVRLIAAESMSFPRSASAAAKMATVWGVLASISSEFSIPVIQTSPQNVKKVVCGSKQASKKEVQRAIEQRYPGQFEDFKACFPATRYEHGFDAAAVLVSCLDGEIVRMARSVGPNAWNQ